MTTPWGENCQGPLSDTLSRIYSICFSSFTYNIAILLCPVKYFFPIERFNA